MLHMLRLRFINKVRHLKELSCSLHCGYNVFRFGRYFHFASKNISKFYSIKLSDSVSHTFPKVFHGHKYTIQLILQQHLSSCKLLKFCIIYTHYTHNILTSCETARKLAQVALLVLKLPHSG